MSIRSLLQTRSFRYSVWLYLLFNGFFLALVLIRPGDSYTFTIIDDIGLSLAWLLATLFCLVGFEAPRKRSARAALPTIEERIHQWAPVFLSIGMFCEFIGQLIYTYYDIHHLPNFPSWADVAYLGAFPFLAIGIFFLPSSHHSTNTIRWCILFDSLIIMITLITFSWYFALGPIMLQGSETPLAKAVGTAYPFFDLLLIFSAIQLTLRANDPALWFIVRWLILGLIIIVTTDSIYDYQTFQHIYQNGWQDAGWPLGYMLLGLAVQAWNIIHSQQKTIVAGEEPKAIFSSVVAALMKARSGKWHSLLPYALIPAIEILTIYAWYTGATSVLAQGVYIGNVTLISLIVLRQIFVSRQMRINSNRLYYLQDQARNRDKLRAQQESYRIMTDFLVLASHELRTPLTGIKGNLQLVQHRLERLKDYGEGEPDRVNERIAQTQNPLASASQSVLQQEHMISAMIDHARIQANILTLSQKRCDLRAIVEAAVTQRQQSVPEHRIILEMPAIQQAVPVIVDEERITQVINTYLTNAINYSPPRQPVTVQLTVKDTVAQVSVCDEGPGIPIEEQGHLWECFHRTKGMSIQHDLDLNLGLGFYLCRAFIEYHHGSVGMQSTPAHGATFWFTLPTLHPNNGDG